MTAQYSWIYSCHYYGMRARQHLYRLSPFEGWRSNRSKHLGKHSEIAYVSMCLLMSVIEIVPRRMDMTNSSCLKKRRNTLQPLPWNERHSHAFTLSLSAWASNEQNDEGPKEASAIASSCNHLSSEDGNATLIRFVQGIPCPWRGKAFNLPVVEHGGVLHRMPNNHFEM